MIETEAYCLILYDITCDKRRRKIFKLLETYGGSYQFSVFEARLRPTKLARLEAGLRQLMDRKEDRLAIVRLCESCRPKAKLLGTQHTTICQHVIII